MVPTGKSRILQVHPTRQCNLRCLHCYSSSSPEERVQIDFTLLCGAISAAYAEGYSVVNVSGGEPLVYKQLYNLLAYAKKHNLTTTMVTNGMLLDERRLKSLPDVLDAFAISLDGIRESHNRMRASEKAFDTMVSRLEGIRQSGIPFGFIFTLTQYNLHELEWVVNFAIEQGACLLQIHPLEEVGRASQLVVGAKPDRIESLYSYVEVARLQSLFGDKISIQLDLTSSTFFLSHPGKFLADSLSQEQLSLPLAEIVSPLIVETDGTVVPLQYGFPREYALGNLHQSSLSELVINWRQNKLFSFKALCQRVFDEMRLQTNTPVFNWYETVSYHAQHHTS